MNLIKILLLVLFTCSSAFGIETIGINFSKVYGNFPKKFQNKLITSNPLIRKKYYEISFTAKDRSESFNLYPDVIKNNKIWTSKIQRFLL